jgi:hypothetical protein
VEGWRPLKAPRGKRLSLLIGSIGLAVVAGAAFASRDIIQTAWYAQTLRSEDVTDQKAAVVSLGRLRTKRAARVLVAYLGDARCPLRSETMQALKDMGEVATEPLAEAFQVLDDFAGKPERRLPGKPDLGVEVMLAVLLELQREEPVVRSLLENIGSKLDVRVDVPPFGKYLAWKSGVQVIEGRPCRIFLFNPLQTILLTDVGGRVVTWRQVEAVMNLGSVTAMGQELGGEFLSCELETINGAVILIIACQDTRSARREQYCYRLTLRGIDP